MLNAILSRWARTRAAASPSTLERSTLVASPARSGGDSLWQSLLRWMPGETDPWGARAQTKPASELPAARAEFEACLADLPGESVTELLRSIRRSRSLRDLWHLRTWLYTEVARAHSQQQAEQTLARLKPFFVGRNEMLPPTGRRH